MKWLFERGLAGVFIMAISGVIIYFFLYMANGGFGAQCKEIGLTGLNYERCVKQKAEGTWDPDTFELRDL